MTDRTRQIIWKIVLAASAAAPIAHPQPRLIFHEDFTRISSEGLPESWKLWSPAPHLKLATAVSGQAFLMSGTGNANAKTRLSRAIGGLESSQWYRFEVTYTASNIPATANSVLAVVQWLNETRMRVLVPEGRSGAATSIALTMQLPEEARGTVNLHLLAGFIPSGSVAWREVKVQHLPSYVPPRRPVNVAVIDSNPPRPGPVEANARHYAAEIDKACTGPRRPDIVVLPENFNRTGVTGNFVVSLDSEYMRIVSDAVRRNRVYLAGSIRTSRDGAVFNTAILLDRQGRLADYYDKAHLTVGEIVFSELARGERFRIFDTDFGKVGVSICWDFHYPEMARLMALEGADLIVLPTGVDARLREDGIQRGSEYAGKAFVLENRIPLVVSTTLGGSRQPSLIIDQHGKVHVRSSDSQHIIHASLDLAAKEYQWTRDDFQSAYRVGRRPELYGGLGLK
jgi:predicted amidohydrolase